MPGAEQVATVVREWVIKADNDLLTATHTLGLDDDCPTDTVCFHAQQCVEKYLKALLTLRGLEFPRTHDMQQLVERVPPGERPVLSTEEQDRLTEYATVLRYPGGYEPVALAEARRAVALARRVRTQVRRRLPRVSTKRAQRAPSRRPRQ